MYIFSYGSNMHLNRIRQRVPSTTTVCSAFIRGYTMQCNKVSVDGSAKCTLRHTDRADSITWGVIYTIDQGEKPQLDIAEGLGAGYHEKFLKFINISGQQFTAQVYIANDQFLDDTLQPYDWYKQYVLVGARQHRLPPKYIGMIASMATMPDPDVNRRQMNLRILKGLESGSR
jgi:gamma-glutamylcyclotransferase